MTASPSKARVDDFAGSLHEKVPALKGVELITEGLAGASREPLRKSGAESLDYRAAGFDLSRGPWRIFPGESLAGGCACRAVTANHAGALAWDLFAGVGLFARRLAEKFSRVIAVESAPAAMAALEHNLSGTKGTAAKAEVASFLRQHHR